jgi:hypothetical protein
MKTMEIGGKGGSHGRQGRVATALAVERSDKGDGWRETEEARAAEELCCLGGNGSSWRKTTFPPDDKS